MRVSVTSTGSLTEALDDLTRSLTQAQRQAGQRVATVARTSMTSNARGRHALSLSGMGATLAVKTKVTARTDSSTVSVSPKPAGAWAIVEEGADPHLIVPKRGKVLAFDGVFTARVRHPGTPGTRAWSTAADATEPVVERAIAEVFDRAVQ
jgi:hypothetical protein